MTSDNQYYCSLNQDKKNIVLIRSEIIYLTIKYFRDLGFIYIEPPILHEAIKKKKSEIYLSLYNEKYSLSSSNALFMGMYAAEFNKVFTISKCFRDENKTGNHLIEFNILEVELLNCGFEELIIIIESYLRFIFQKLSENELVKNMPKLMKRIKKLESTFNPKIVTYDKFISKTTEYDLYENTDISDIDYLISRELEDVFIIVDYPTKYSTWTAKPKGNGKSYALNIIMPESYGELCEGCERTNDINLLQSKINIAKASKIQWYVDSLKKINSRRSGFGLGIDRLIRWIVGANSIEEIHIFPRVKECD